MAKGDARGSARLPRPDSSPARQVLRPAAVAADLQAAARDLRVRALLPDRACLRDEDLRADRLQELTQLDVEMAFVESRRTSSSLRSGSSERISSARRSGASSSRPFPRMILAGGDELRYGSDKPDLRFGLEIQDATEVTRGSEFGVFASAQAVRYLSARERSPAPRSRSSRRWRRRGARRASRTSSTQDGEVALPDRKVPLRDRSSRRSGRSPGRRSLFVAGDPELASKVLGGLRLHLGRELDLVDRQAWKFIWITTCRSSSGTRTWAVDGACTTRSLGRPTPAIAELVEGDPGAARAAAYDLIWNGWSWLAGRSGSTSPNSSADVHSSALARRRADEVRLPSGRTRDGRAAARRHRDRASTG